MEEINIKLNQEENALYKKWKTLSFFSLLFTTIYFIWIGFNVKDIVISFEAMFLPALFLINALVFHFSSMSYKDKFLKLINANHGKGKKKHKMIELMEKKKKEEEERESSSKE